MSGILAATDFIKAKKSNPNHASCKGGVVVAAWRSGLKENGKKVGVSDSDAQQNFSRRCVF